MWEASHAVRSIAEPSAVWALWSDPGRWSQWNDQIAQAELNGSFEVGTVARIKFKRGGTIHFTITKIEPERVFTDEARLPGARMGHEHRIDPTGEGIEIRNRLYITGPLARLYALLIGRSMRRSVPRFVERERELAEPRREPRTQS